MSRLLALLDESAASAAARSGEVDEAAALQVKTFANVGALQSGGEPPETAAAGAAEEKALKRNERKRRYRIHARAWRHTEVLIGS